MDPGFNRVPVGRDPNGNNTPEIPIRLNNRREQNTGRGGRNIRQVPGGGRHRRPVPEPAYYCQQIVNPSHHSVHFIVPGSRPGRVAALIAGIVLAILGVCIFPADPVGGLVITALGLTSFAIGALSKSSCNTSQC